MNWLHYLVEANLYLAIFYSVYYLVLSRETHYTLNRVYLLLSCVVSFIIPVIQLGILKPIEQPVAVTNYVYNTNEILLKPIEITLIAPHYTWQDYLFFAYLAGSAILLLALLFRLYQLFRLTRSNQKAADAGYKLIYLNDTNTAFSFFNFLFIGTKADGADTIIKHELVHIRQKHSADIVFIEILKVINWFNPFIYLLQFSLKAIHEYIADEQTAATEADALTYSSFLVQNAYGLSGSSITHSFFNYNLLKKRIIMLNQKRSGNLARLKYLLAVPICGGLLCASTLAFSKDYGWVDIVPKESLRQPLASKSSYNKHRFKLTQEGLNLNGVTCIGDEITVLVKKDLVKTYTVNTITAADKAYLSKYYKLKIEVINSNIPHTDINQVVQVPGSSHIAPPSPTPPLTKVYMNGNADTITVISKENQPTSAPTSAPAPKVIDVKLIPPPPASQKNNVVIFPVPKYPKQTTDKGYRYAEGGQMVNGKAYLNVIIYNKNGTYKRYFNDKMTSGEIAILKDKYGYTFPDRPRFSHILAPPPPAQPAKLPQQKTPLPLPPAAPIKPAFVELSKYMGKHLLYPAKAHDNNIGGNIVAKFYLNSDHKISDVKFVQGIGNGFDEEVFNILKSYPLAINDKTGSHPYYIITVNFSLIGDNGEIKTKSFDPIVINNPNYAGVVQIVGYVK